MGFVPYLVQGILWLCLDSDMYLPKTHLLFCVQIEIFQLGYGMHMGKNSNYDQKDVRREGIWCGEILHYLK